MKGKNVSKWIALDMLIFIVINAFLIWQFQDNFTLIRDIGYFKLLVLGLATYRLANIISNEKITKPFRAPFVNDTQKEGKTVEEPKRAGFKGALGHLIYCPSCTGVWLAAAMVYFYVFFPEPTFLIGLFLALSAIERIITISLGTIKKNKEK